jgi:hypothetical protein
VSDNALALQSVLCVLLCYTAVQSYAVENLECPEIGPDQVPDLIGDGTGGGLVTTDSFIDLANEINDARRSRSTTVINDVVSAAWPTIQARG